MRERQLIGLAKEFKRLKKENSQLRSRLSKLEQAFDVKSEIHHNVNKDYVDLKKKYDNQDINEYGRRVLETAWAITVGYDGFEHSEDLKEIIDELSDYIQIVLMNKSEEFLEQNNAMNPKSVTTHEFINEVKNS